MKGSQILLVLTLLLISVGDTPAIGNPEILAGTGKAGYGGDGGHISAVQLNVPSEIFVTSSGELYIVDTSNYRIRRVDVEGTTTTVVGTGQRVYTGDDIHASKTGILNPSSVVVDGQGSVYFSEWSGHRVRKVDPSGNVTTIAGNGESGYVGEGLPATETSLWTPSRIFLDGKGNLFIAEWSANRIRKVDASGTITTVAGNGERKFSGDGGPATEASIDRPNGLFVTKTGDIYISDLGNNRIRKIDKDGTIQTVAGDGAPMGYGDGGPATDAAINAPAGLFVDDEGNLFISDSRNNRIRKIDPSGTIRTILNAIPVRGKDGKTVAAKLRSPTSVFVDAKGSIYVSDGSMHRVIYLSEAAAPTTLAVSADGVTGFDTSTGILDGIVDFFG